MLGHMEPTSTKNTAEYLGIPLAKWNAEPCLSCAVGKAKQKNLVKKGEESKNPDDLFSSDISSCKHVAYRGAKFWLLVTDHATNMKWSSFLKQKSQQSEVLLNFVKELKSKYNINIK